MGSGALLGNMVGHCGVAIVLFLALVVPPRVFAQVELAGSWAPRNFEDVEGAEIPVDYTALPLNDEARTRALSYSEGQLAMIERQCEGWPQFFLAVGAPFGLKIWNNTEPAKGAIVSWTIGAWEDRAPMVIWMDGRPHPSAHAEHTRGGFTTGSWEGNTLVARTTHMKAGFLRKNGPPSSDLATMTTRFFRHGDLLTLLVVVEDPIYLAEPYVLSKTYQIAATPVPAVGPPCVTSYEGQEPGAGVPHIPSEKNPFVDELTRTLHIPREAVMGEAHTLYPEYRKQIKDQYTPPPACAKDCGRTPTR
jgi:hypothetical protein